MDGSQTEEMVEKIMPGTKLDHLVFQEQLSCSESMFLHNPDGTPGVQLSVQRYPSCNLRGPFRFLITILPNPEWVRHWTHIRGIIGEPQWFLDKDCALREGLLRAQQQLDHFQEGGG